MKYGKWPGKLRGMCIVIIILLSLIGLLMLSSCEKKEPLWELPPPGSEETDQVAMGEMYDDCVFYKFSTKAQTTRNLNSWHLAFESAPQGWNIRINGGRAMQACNSGTTQFEQLQAVSASTNWDWDTPDGNRDSTAIGKWFLDTETFESAEWVYIVDMGLNTQPPYKKLQVLGMNDSAFTIKYSNLDGTDEHTHVVLKSAKSNHTYFDLFTNSVVDFEPAVYNYDILFSRYRYIFFEDGTITPYLVNGVLLNPVNTAAARITTTNNFDSISYDMVKDIPLSNKADTIGFDWKYYDFELSKYQVVNNLYIVKDAEGNLWKVQFYDFYNDNLTKGYPKFRFQRL
jgi:hypothetical protein